MVNVQREYIGTTVVLEEVCDYLSRLPLSVETAHMIRKIREFLDADGRQFQLEGQRISTIRMAGASLSDAGLPVIQAELVGALLKLRAPMLNTSDADRFGRLVLGRLRDGVTIELEHSPSDVRWRPPLYRP